MSVFIPSIPNVPFINPPAPVPFPAPDPAPAGTLVRKPRHLIYVNGELLPYPIDISITRGLDQDVATCDIQYPYPLPDTLPYWSRVAVLIAGTPPDAGLPFGGLLTRFTGYFINEQAGLWPGTRTLHCEDMLALAKYTFTPQEIDLSDETDISAIKRILGPPDVPNGAGGVGFQDTLLHIEGIGDTLGDISEANLFWEQGQTAMEKLQDIDSISLGYRVYATAGGLIYRTKINTIPDAEVVLHWFNEGVDIEDGSASTEIVDAKNEITVAGWDGQPATVPDPNATLADLTAQLVTLNNELAALQAADPPDDDAIAAKQAQIDDVQTQIDNLPDPFDWRKNSYWIRFLMLKASGVGLFNPTEVAEWILSQLNRTLIKVTFSTHLDVFFQGEEIIGLTSPRLNVNQKFWVQSVQVNLSASGQFTQTVTAVSELGPYNRRTLNPPIEPPTNQVPGQPIPPPAVPDVLPPSAADIIASMSIEALDKELAAPPAELDNTGEAVFGVFASDTSTSRQGQIVSWSWVASGPGVLITTGNQQTFTTYFSDLTPETTLTLTVTDSNGSQATVVQPVYTGGTPLHSRKLYACTDGSYEAFDGNTWRTGTPLNAATVQCVGNGPYWGAGSYVAYAPDDLLTPAIENPAFPGGATVTAIWVHETDSSFVAVGGDDGGVSVSTDKAATWTVKSPVPGGQVDFIIVSIFNKRQIHAVTPGGWYKSEDQGTTWAQVRAGSFSYLELSHTRNIVITSAGQLQRAETGTPFTGNTSPIVAATAHIRADVFYAIAADGTTWYCAPGSYTLTAGTPIPAGTPFHAGAYRDGQIVDLIYFAAQDGGLFKTMDGFKTANGYLRLRAVGRLSP